MDRFVIDLNSTSFDPGALANLLGEAGPMSDVLVDGKWLRLPNFGIVVIGLDKLADHRWASTIEETLDLNTPTISGPVFSCPEDWQLPQLVKTFGLFKSTGEARRNGWNRPIEDGLSSQIIRLNRIKGVLWTFKVPAERLNTLGLWEACDGDC